jgi:hypothetical protein
MAVTFHRLERILVGDSHAPGSTDLAIITGFPHDPTDRKDVWLEWLKQRQEHAMVQEIHARRGDPIRTSTNPGQLMSPLVVDLARLPERADHGAWTSVIDMVDDLVKLENAATSPGPARRPSIACLWACRRRDDRARTTGEKRGMGGRYAALPYRRGVSGRAGPSLGRSRTLGW